LTTNAATPDRPLPRYRRVVAAFRRHPRAVLLVALLTGLLVVAGVLLAPQARALYHARAADRAIARGQFDEALDHLAVCLKVWPDRASTRFLAARTARRAGRLDEAERHLTRLQAAHGTSDQTALEWALLRVERGDLERAEVYLRTTIGPDHPDAAIVCEALARGYLLTDRLTDLRGVADLWLQVRPGDTHALYYKGLACERLGQQAEAIAAYQQAIDADSENLDARLHLAELLLVIDKDAERAREHYEWVRGRRPSDPAVIIGLARCRRELGDLAGARDLLDDLLAAHPNHARALAERGRVALADNDPAGAERWLRRAVARAPEDAAALYSLQNALSLQDMKDEAKQLEPRIVQLKADLKRYTEVVPAVAKEPRNVALRIEAAEICRRLGRKDEQRRWLATALLIDPQNAAARAALAAADEESPAPPSPERKP
jgi:tetratricopeptide (TPR) repeat protein